MDWTEICRTLTEKMDSLAGGIANPPEGKAAKQKELLAVEQQERPVVDEAARIYAHKGSSPLLTPNQSLLLYIRIGHAAQFAEFLSGAMADSSIMFSDYYTGRQKASVLEFLLVDYWEFAGCARWKAT